MISLFKFLIFSVKMGMLKMRMLKAGGETERPFQARTDRVIDIMSIALKLP